MVYAMSGYPRSVTLQKNIYVGGGTAENFSERCTILLYNVDKDEWSSLPKYQFRWFAMIAINNRLTVVGGKDASTRKTTNQLAVFDQISQKWTTPHPPMPTARCWPAVSTYNKWLLVAGGYGGSSLTTVELLNTSTKQWLTAAPLPTQCGRMTSTILQDNWYLVSDSKEVFSVSLPEIVSNSISKCPATNSTQLWHRLPDTPLKYSTAIALRGSILVVGGLLGGSLRSTAIHLYLPESEKWTKVGDLPSARHYCSCILLPSGELLIAGGYESYATTSRVDVASIVD